jgi:hypothetical protein
MKIFDRVRKVWVAATPEERVRQALLAQMVDVLGFPRHTLLVEQELKALPHLARAKDPIPDRRADLICLAQGIHPEFPLYPLLLIECKDKQIDQKAVDQVIGYNCFVRAPFLAIAAQGQIQMGHWDGGVGRYVFVPLLPPYADLLIRAQKR